MEDAVLKQKVTLSAVVHPVCVCGKTWLEHVAPLQCVYRPVTPVKDYGVIYEREDI